MKFALLVSCATLMSPSARADEVSDLKAQLQSLQQQTAALQQQLQKMAEKLGQTSPASAETAKAASAPAPLSAAAEPKPLYIERKPVDGVTLYTRGGEITLYANLDVSVDSSTKGIAGKTGPDGAKAVGQLGWQPAISTNLSYFGIRGFQKLGGAPFDFIYQLETQIDIAATSGVSETNSSESNVVKGALTSRNSYIGLASPVWGAVKIGKTDAPYKNATARMNPFSGMLGDYQVIMANTGGDNRVEFGVRLDHSIWYEAPTWNGLAFTALYSPGQNRAKNSDNIAGGESDCTGGNIPGSGGIVPVTCSDGSFSDAYSTSLGYTSGPLYLVAAYERHMKVNRSSDITGIYGSNNAYSIALANQDVADEDAAKIGVQYLFPTQTSVSGIFESLHRYVPSDLRFQNERQRNGTWLAISQALSAADSLHFGWAHAFRTPGDPGQHNDSNLTPPGGVAGMDFTAGSHADNSADMLTLALKHQLSKNLTLYGDWAATYNGPAAHYDLGAGGRAITTDCHDASDATGGLVASNPHCYSGGKLMGVSIGMDWKM